jgi:hypothetical protein
VWTAPREVVELLVQQDPYVAHGLVTGWDHPRLERRHRLIEFATVGDAARPRRGGLHDHAGAGCAAICPGSTARNADR